MYVIGLMSSWPLPVKKRENQSQLWHGIQLLEINSSYNIIIHNKIRFTNRNSYQSMQIIQYLKGKKWNPYTLL